MIGNRKYARILYSILQESTFWITCYLTFVRIKESLSYMSFCFYFQLLKNMTSPELGAEKRAAIDDTRTYGPDYYNPSFGVNWDHGTAHLSVLGPDGDAVSITSTINL